MLDVLNIVIANVGFWFNFIIPFGGALYFVLTNREYIWKEFGIQVLATLGYITIAYMILFSTTTDLRDTEYWNGHVTKFEYFEKWTERVTYTEQVCNGSGKSRSCRTVTKTRNDYHAPYWQLCTSNGEIVSISSNEFEQAARKFGQKEIDIRRSNQVSFGDGDKYISYPNITIPSAIPHSYTNFVTAAKNAVIKQEVSDAEIAQGIKDKSLRPYPAVYEDGMGVPNIMRVIDTTNSIGVLNYLKDLNVLANKNGKIKQVNPIIYITNRDRSFKATLEAYWKKAKKNDAVLILGIDEGTGKVVWSDVIAWTNNTDFIVDMSNGFDSFNIKTDRQKIINRFDNLIITEYKRKPMKEFSYLKENITLEWYWQLIVLLGNIVISFFITRYFLTNHERKSRNWGRK